MFIRILECWEWITIHLLKILENWKKPHLFSHKFKLIDTFDGTCKNSCGSRNSIGWSITSFRTFPNITVCYSPPSTWRTRGSCPATMNEQKILLGGNVSTYRVFKITNVKKFCKIVSRSRVTWKEVFGIVTVVFYNTTWSVNDPPGTLCGGFLAGTWILYHWRHTQQISKFIRQ